jgi:hypothetical protein
VILFSIRLDILSQANCLADRYAGHSDTATAGFSEVLAISALISSVTAIFCQKAAGQQSQMRLIGQFPKTKGRSPPPGLNRPYQKRFIARHPMCLDNSISYFLLIANFSE